jgi:hypothetical protein
MATGSPWVLAKSSTSAGPGGRRARDERRPHLLGDAPGRHLVPQVPDGLRRGPDPGEPGVDHGLGEPGVLRQEAVTGVDGVGSGSRRRRHQFGRVEVGGRRRRPGEGHCGIGHTDVGGVPVLVGIDGNAAQPSVGCGPDDTHGDLTPVGDEHSVEGRRGYRGGRPRGGGHQATTGRSTSAGSTSRSSSVVMAATSAAGPTGARTTVSAPMAA